MENFPANSHKAKEAAEDSEKPIEKKFESVVTGTVIVQKPSIGQRFKKIFFGGDFKTAAKHIGMNVIVPSLRDLAFNTGERFLDRIIYRGDNRPSRAGRTIVTNPFGPKVTYNTSLTQLMQDPRMRGQLPRQGPQPDNPRNDPGSLLIPIKEDAERVVENLLEAIDMYDIVSVGDLYEMIGLPSSHVEHKWGWEKSQFAGGLTLEQHREGYLLRLPPTVPLT